MKEIAFSNAEIIDHQGNRFIAAEASVYVSPNSTPFVVFSYGDQEGVCTAPFSIVGKITFWDKNPLSDEK